MQYLHSRSFFSISRAFNLSTNSQFSPVFLNNFPTMNQRKDRGSEFSNSNSNGASSHNHRHRKDKFSASVTGNRRVTKEIYVPPHQRKTGTWVKKSDNVGVSGETQMVGSSFGNNTSAGSCDKVNSYSTGRSFSSVSSSSEIDCDPLVSSACKAHQFDSAVGVPEVRDDGVNILEHSDKGESPSKEHVGGSLENKILEVSIQGEGQTAVTFGTLSNSVVGQQSGSHGEYPRKPNDSVLSTEAAGTFGKLKTGQEGSRRHNSPQHSNRRNASPKKVYASCNRVDVVQPKPERGWSMERINLDQSKDGKLQFKKSSPERGRDNDTPPQFNICLKKHQKSPYTLKPSLHKKNKEKREYSMNDPRRTLLRPGMVLLKNFISPNDQIEIIKKCQDLGVGPGGFYQPGYNGGAKLSLRMMCLGKDWDPQTRSYNNIRSIDNAIPPIIPDAFRKLVSDAIQASYHVMREAGVKNPDKAIPWMDPDICIVNFYTENGKLGLHQDRDETDESIKKGLPVVSFSIGDSAEFLYGDERDVDKAEKIELKSGDILIFGGKSRRVFHGVTSIKPDSAPKFLLDEADLRPGRLNLTFRQY